MLNEKKPSPPAGVENRARSSANGCRSAPCGLIKRNETPAQGKIDRRPHADLCVPPSNVNDGRAPRRHNRRRQNGLQTPAFVLPRRPGTRRKAYSTRPHLPRRENWEHGANRCSPRPPVAPQIVAAAFKKNASDAAAANPGFSRPRRSSQIMNDRTVTIRQAANDVR